MMLRLRSKCSVWFAASPPNVNHSSKLEVVSRMNMLACQNATSLTIHKYVQFQGGMFGLFRWFYRIHETILKDALDMETFIGMETLSGRRLWLAEDNNDYENENDLSCITRYLVVSCRKSIMFWLHLFSSFHTYHLNVSRSNPFVWNYLAVFAIAAFISLNLSACARSRK